MFRIPLIILAFSFLTSLNTFESSRDFEAYALMTGISINLNTTKKNLNINGTYASLLNKSEYLVRDPKIKISSGKTSSFIEAERALFNKDSKRVDFRNSVNLYTSNEQEIVISANKISFDLQNEKLVTQSPVDVSLRNMKVKALGLVITQDERLTEATFNKGEISIDEEGILKTGFANKIILLPEQNELVMEGEAYLNQGDFSIRADTIHYDLKENKIIKSLNSKIRTEI